MGRTSDAKQQLLDTAFRLIWEKSYFSVGVNDICRRARVRPGSFYYFFPSKEALAIAALDVHWGQLKADLLDVAFNKQRAPLSRIAYFFTHVADFHQQAHRRHQPILGCAFGSLVGELSLSEGPIRRRVLRFFEALKQYLKEALADARKAGVIRCPASSLEPRANALLAYFEGCLLLARATNDPRPLTQAVAYALHLARGTT